MAVRVANVFEWRLLLLLFACFLVLLTVVKFYYRLLKNFTNSYKLSACKFQLSRISGSNFTEGVENTPHPQCCTGRKKPSTFTFSPITGGGGGLLGPDHQIIEHNYETALSSTSKLAAFLFLYINHIFSEVD